MPFGDQKEATIIPNKFSSILSNLIPGYRRRLLARGLHNIYLQERQAHGHSNRTSPSVVDWKHLPKHLRREILAKADGILRDLAKLGYALKPLTDPQAGSFHFSEREVEYLAMSEHNRIVKDRLSRGWRYSGEPMDPNKRTSPDLVPWNELPDQKKILANNATKALPVTLAQAGFQIVPR